MKKKIFLMLAAFAAFTTIITSVCTSFSYYNFYKASMQDEIKTETRMLANDLKTAGSPEETLESYRTSIGATRIALVDVDGNVRYDSDADALELENHGEREEILTAEEAGSGEAVRYSETLQTDSYYYALRLPDGSVLRLSRQISSMASVFNDTFPLVGGIIVLVLLASIYLAAFLTKRIIAPIDQTVEQMKGILQNDKVDTPPVETYGELDYFVRTIKSMRSEIRSYLDTIQSERATFDSITRNMQEGFLLLDSQKNILSVNASALHMLQAPDDRSYQGENLLVLSRASGLKKAIEEVLSGNVTISFAEKTETGYDYRFFVSPVLGEEKEGTGIMVFVVDITKEMQADQIRQDFAANVSHELKTPLTSISGFAEMLESGMISESDDIRQSAARIHKEASRLITLINDIIRLSNIENSADSDTKEEVNLCTLATEAAETLRPVAMQKGVSISFPKGTAPFYGNRTMLYELFYNLIDNAVKYNKKGGTVAVSITKGSDAVQMVVEDNGIGIPRELFSRIFERFYRVDKSRSKQSGGTGLGLSIVKHVVEYHAGTISVQSELNEGTKVTVRLPL